jgi:thioredoxin reductase
MGDCYIEPLSVSVLQEKQIYDMKRKKQELEKYNFVLNYKITELKNQTEPKDTEIKNKQKQMQDVRAQHTYFVIISFHKSRGNNKCMQNFHCETSRAHLCVERRIMLKLTAGGCVMRT